MSLTLSRTGAKLPLVGFGLWKVTKSQCADTVFDAIKAGYRLLDGAADYGNEKEAGEGVKKAIDAGVIKREDIWITSKLWNTFHAKEHVKAACKLQLEHWGLDYFDLYLVHFPIALQYVEPSHRYPPEWHGDDGKVHTQNTPFHETWAAMEELVDEGLVKNIGVSNTSGSLLIDILRYARYPPQVLQVEIHPYLTQKPILDLAKTFGIAVTGYSSFGPQGYYEIDMDKKAVSLLTSEAVTTIASKHGKSPAQVLLRWNTQQGVAVIPKSNSLARLVENLSSSDFDLSEEDIKAIDGLNLNLRLNDPWLIDPRLSIFA